MATSNLAQSAESRLEAGAVGFLGREVETPNRRCAGVPNVLKKVRLSPLFGGDVDVIEIDGHDPIEAISADWSDDLIDEAGSLCTRTRVVFDVHNPGGAASWGAGAQGAIVVAVRGGASFSEMASNAVSSGAVALIVVDNEVRWKNDWVMTKDADQAPPIPAVLVSKDYAHCLCSGCPDLTAAISRRPANVSARALARNFLEVASWGLISF
mmetsp:Transcript_135389/g.260102  ORF Transcript_135389/g.260102 Transcript_135389/m.260102 type:complete len:211 (+) Transcript_135389:38-670(+)